MMVIDNVHNFGDTVYLKTDTAQDPRLVTGIKVHPGGVLMYELTRGCSEYWHYDFEISVTKDVLITTTN